MATLADDLTVAFSNPERFLPVVPSPEGRRKFAAVFRAKMLGAKRFFLDDDFTRTATWLGVQHPEILLSALSRARTPYGKTWIEWPKAPQMEAAGYELEQDAPERAGVLIERLDDQEPIFTMYTFSKPSDAKSEYEVACSPLCVSYHLKDAVSELYPAEEKLFLDTAQVSQEYSKVHLLGSAYNKAVSPNIPLVTSSGREVDEELAYRRKVVDQLTRHGMYSISPFFRPLLKEIVMNDVKRNFLRREIRESAGSWRFIISVLCLMNSHDYVQAEDHPRQQSRFVNGKKIVFNQNICVRLKLPGKISKERIIRDLGESIPKPQRSVRGSFRTNSRWFPGLLGCNHVFVSETAMREACVIPGCSYKRWWVNDYMRGDLECGVISKDHLVTN